MKLFKAINGIGIYWIVAKSFDEANDKLAKLLNAGEGYGFSGKRVVTEIHLIADHITNETDLTNKFLVI